MKPIRITVRILSLVLFSLYAMVVMALYSDSSKGINAKQKKFRQWWFSKVVSISGLKLTIKGSYPENNETALWVSNHVSWLDIPVIGSAGVAFLSKAEIRKWPVIGWLGEKGGTVFIQRGGKNASQIASETIAKNINTGDSVLVFPEATTTDGTDVKQFHARIFAPALDHHLRVQPIAIRYLDENGNCHPNVIWGDESFLSNLLQVIGETNIYVELNFLPSIDAECFTERKPLANLAYEKIREVVKAPKEPA